MAEAREATGTQAPDPREFAENVGLRLRTRRVEQNLSLRELARRLGISASALSQIETGKSRPSVRTLYTIVSELGMSLDELFNGFRGPPNAGGAVAEAVQDSNRAVADPEAGLVQRGGRRSAIQLESGVRWERLTASPDPEADFLYVVYDVGGSSSSGDGLIRHAGREYGLVLSGTLEVTVGFETYALGPGDSISFDSTTPHRLRNNGREPVHGVWFVVGRGGDVRAGAFPEGQRA